MGPKRVYWIKTLGTVLAPSQPHIGTWWIKDGECTEQTEELVVVTLPFLDFILRTVADLEGVTQESDRIQTAGKTNASDCDSGELNTRQVIIRQP